MHLDPASSIAGLVAQAAMAADPEASPTLLTYIRDGGALSYVLIALSVLAVALTVRNVLALRTREFAPPEVMSTLELLLGEGRVAEAERYCKDPANRCFVTTVLAEAFARARTSGFGLLEFRGAVEEVARGEADEVHRMNDGLGVIAAVGPMLGLLGTVIGMIGAFRAIGGLQGAARSNELATFMSMALVNTAEGLIVAIPATIAFALFRRRIDRIMHRIGRDLERFAGMVATGGARAAQAQRDAATQAAQAAQGGGGAAAARGRA
ncbi:MAG: MotA/TolQ/ExbB proton channel family protein [Phycisphaerales bacterium]